MSPFKTPFQITQKFGVNKEYYQKFGLTGHEGIDVIPTGSDWSVLCLEDGIVVKDDDIAGDPRSDAYGKSVTVWHPSIKRATQYCHLANNFVSLNQQVKKGDRIGVMGSTGNSSGPHLHLNLFEVDANGIRQNKNNGTLGGIDPLSLLEAGGLPANYDEIIGKASNWDEVVKLGYHSIAALKADLDKFKSHKCPTVDPKYQKFWQETKDKANAL